jgi:hypothetical protein
MMGVLALEGIETFRRAPSIKFADRRARSLAPTSCRQGGLQTLNKPVSVEWLRQVAHCSGSDRLRAGPLVRECCEENKWSAVTPVTQGVLQLDAAHAGHLNVRHDTGEIIKEIRLQELLGRCERMHDISE